MIFANVDCPWVFDWGSIPDWLGIFVTAGAAWYAVHVAQKLVAKSDYQKEASAMFSEMVEHANNYRHALLDLFVIEEELAKIDKIQGDFLKAGHDPDELAEMMQKSGMQDTLTHLATGKREARNYKNAEHGKLDAIRVKFGFSFGDAAIPCAGKIRELLQYNGTYDNSDKSVSEQIAFEKYQQDIQDHINPITTEYGRFFLLMQENNWDVDRGNKVFNERKNLENRQAPVSTRIPENPGKNTK